MAGPRDPYRPIGDNPDPGDHPPGPVESGPVESGPLVHVEDDDPAHDDSAAPDD